MIFRVDEIANFLKSGINALDTQHEANGKRLQHPFSSGDIKVKAGKCNSYRKAKLYHNAVLCSYKLIRPAKSIYHAFHAPGNKPLVFHIMNSVPQGQLHNQVHRQFLPPVVYILLYHLHQ